MTWEVNKLALPGFRHSVDWWGLPTRLEWALAPDRGAGVTKLGPGLVAHGLRASAWPQGAGTKVLGWRGVATSLEAGGRSPGRVPGVTLWGLLPTWQFPTHANSCGLAGHRPSGCVSDALRWKLASFVQEKK